MNHIMEYYEAVETTQEYLCVLLGRVGREVDKSVQHCGSQSVLPRPAAPASPGNLLGCRSSDPQPTYGIRNSGNATQ